MNRVSDEPQLNVTLDAPKKKRVRLIPESAIHMPLETWYNLLLRHMTLVDLVHMKRVCKSFAVYKKLAALIKLKTKAAFSRLKSVHWNRMAATNNSTVMGDAYIKTHSGKFMCVKHITSGYHVGAFSSKDRAVDQFIADYTEFNQWLPPTMYVNDWCVRFIVRNGVFIYVGINDAITAYIAVVPLYTLQMRAQQLRYYDPPLFAPPTPDEHAFLAQYGFE
jgi:hypothetical protein